MKNFYSVMAILSIFVITLMQSTAISQNCNCSPDQIVPPNEQNITVNANQTKCLVSGTYNSNVSIASGGTLCVGNDVQLTISNFNNLQGTLVNSGTIAGIGNLNNYSGTIKNYGTITISNSINFSSGGRLENYSRLTMSAPNFNGSATIENYQDGTMYVNNNFPLGNGSTLTNRGYLIFQSGDFNTNSGTFFYNYGRAYVQNGNFNPSGLIRNEGWFYARRMININSGAIISNKCRFISDQGFNNNSASFTNDGMIWVTGQDNSNGSRIQNNGGSIFENSAISQLRGVNFDNSGGTVRGSGEYYFTGTTRQQGSFIGSDANNPIKFYDTSVNPEHPIFDVGNPGANVTRPATLNPADTTYDYPYCASFVFRNLPPVLPVTITLFAAQRLNNNDINIIWNTEQEVNIEKYIIEKSLDGKNYTVLYTEKALGSAKSNKYNFVDSYANNTNYNGFVYYRLKVVETNNDQYYSKVVSERFKTDNVESNIVYYPNPFTDYLNINIQTKEEDRIKITLVDIFGKVIMSKEAEVSKGPSIINIDDMGSLPTGIYQMVITADSGWRSVQKLVKN